MGLSKAGRGREDDPGEGRPADRHHGSHPVPFRGTGAKGEAAMTFTAAEKAAEIEKIATIYEATATDFSLVPDFLSRRISIMEAIAEDYRKQVAADQLEADINDEASKVTGYIEWKDAQDAVQQTAD